MRNPLNLLLLFIVVALVARYVLNAGEPVIFFTSALAIVPLAKWMGTATEKLAERTGPGIGGLLNATFGNATELIIAIFGLQAGLTEVVKASITGSIIGNILFVLGLSMLVGGWGREYQKFNQTAAGAAASQLMLALVALTVPAVFFFAAGGQSGSREEIESELVAVLLIISYILSLLFSLRTHPHLYAGETAASGQTEGTGEAEEHEASWSVGRAVGVLAAATIGVAIMAELLVGSVEGVTHQLGWSELFVGVILIPVIGNAAEHLTSVIVARKGQMDLSFSIAIGSSTQVALLIAPVLVFVGLLVGHPLTFLFRPVELVALVSSVLIVCVISLDGESNWFEGAQLLITYGILGVAFFVYH